MRLEPGPVGAWLPKAARHTTRPKLEDASFDRSKPISCPKSILIFSFDESWLIFQINVTGSKIRRLDQWPDIERFEFSDLLQNWK